MVEGLGFRKRGLGFGWVVFFMRIRSARVVLILGFGW